MLSSPCRDSGNPGGNQWALVGNNHLVGSFSDPWISFRRLSLLERTRTGGSLQSISSSHEFSINNIPEGTIVKPSIKLSKS